MTLTSPVSLEKKYETTDGSQVWFGPIIGALIYGYVKNKFNLQSIVWNIHTGLPLNTFGDSLALVEIKPKIKREVWVNMYPNNSGDVHLTRFGADKYAGSMRTECLHHIFEFTEGEGLEEDKT